MIKLSGRLAAMAALVNQGERIADIGTDHGLLPLALWETGISPYVIFSDVQPGPLERAKANIAQHFPGNDFDLRLGSGLETLAEGEVDTVMIAGMGGLLIIQILEANLEKAKSFKKFVFQPRNAQDKLRRWLIDHEFCILDEVLVQEGKYICEIFAASPGGTGAETSFDDLAVQLSLSDTVAGAAPDLTDQLTAAEVCNPLKNEVLWEVSPLLFKKRDPLLPAFIENKINIEQKIKASILTGTTENQELLQSLTRRIELLEYLWERSKKG